MATSDKGVHTVSLTCGNSLVFHFLTVSVGATVRTKLCGADDRFSRNQKFRRSRQVPS